MQVLNLDPIVIVASGPCIMSYSQFILKLCSALNTLKYWCAVEDTNTVVLGALLVLQDPYQYP